MNLLALETSTQNCSVALWWQGKLFKCHECAPRRHGELILQWIDELLTQAGGTLAELSGIAVGVGPGAFTGVRLAVSVAQGLALAHDLGVLPVSTLDAMAFQAAREGAQFPLLVLQDARMDEVYWVAFEVVEEVGQVVASVCAPEALPLDISKAWQVLGSGYSHYQERLSLSGAVLWSDYQEDRYPNAEGVGLFALSQLESGSVWLTPEDVKPLYVRDNVAKKQSQGSGC